MLIFLAFIFWCSLVLLSWTYFGYPGLMLVWTKLHPQPIHADDITPTLTLLIPAYNESDVIQRKLENCLSLDYPAEAYRVLVVDDGSSDGTTEIVEQFAPQGITLIRQPERRGKMAAVNTGFEQASGEIVVLSDSSPLYEQDALRMLVRPFADPKVGVVVGKLAIRDAETGVAKQAGLYWRYEATLRRWESRTGSTVAVHGNMFAMRRDLYRPLTSSTINDEFSLAMEVLRQGYRVIYEPQAISYDEASVSMQDEFNRRTRINAGRYQALFSSGYLRAPNLNIAFRLFSHKLLRPLAPILMILMLIANPLAWAWGDSEPNLFLLAGWWGALVMIGQIGFYALAGLGWLSERRGARRRLIFSIPYFFVSTNMAALVGLWRWLRGSQRVTWKKRSV